LNGDLTNQRKNTAIPNCDLPPLLTISPKRVFFCESPSPEEQLQEPQSDGDQARPHRHARDSGQCPLDPQHGGDGDGEMMGRCLWYKCLVGGLEHGWIIFHILGRMIPLHFHIFQDG